MIERLNIASTSHTMHWRQKLAFAVALILGGFIFFQSAQQAVTYFSFWKGQNLISEPCGQMLVDAAPEKNMLDLPSPATFSHSLLVPYRRNAESVELPKYRAGQINILKCSISKGALKPNLPVFLNFGPVKGEVAALSNGIAVSHETDPVSWIVMFPAADWKVGMTFELRFRNHKRDLLPGPTRPAGVTWTQNLGDSVRETEHSYADRNAEYFVRIGHNIALLTCFAIIYAFGFSYADIAWLTVSLIFTTIATLSFFTDFSRSSSPLAMLDWGAYLIGSVALTSAVLRFNRKSMYQTLPWIALGITMVAYIAYEFAGFRLAKHVYPNYTVYAYMMVVGFITWRHRNSGPKLRRFFKRTMAITMLATSAFHFWQSIWGYDLIQPMKGPVQMLIASLFGMLLAADLVSYRQKYIQSEEERLHEVKRRSDLENNLKVTHAFQNLVLAPSEVESADWVKVRSTTIESAIICGDWVSVFPQDDKKIFVFAGDIAGKGPHAALSAAATIGALSTVDKRDTSLEYVVDTLSRALLTTFKNKSTTTMAAVEIDSQGKTRIFNAGHGFVCLIRQTGNVEVISSNSSPIPIRNPKIQGSIFETTILEDDVILLLTDGILKGSRMEKKLFHDLIDVGRNLTDNQLLEMMMNFQPGIDDDRTAVVIRMGKAS